MTRERIDARGLWWEDFEPPPRVTGTAAKAQARPARVVHPPHTGWAAPREFPNLSAARVIGFDTETKDEGLMAGRGPGAVRGKSHMVGISIATDDRAWYFPFRHEWAGEPQHPLPREKVLEWLSAEVFSTKVPVVGANLLYDLEQTRAEGVRAPAGELFDVQFAEPLIDENARTYSLDSLGSKYLGHGKKTTQLYEWCAESFGGEPNEAQRENIWRAPSSLVGPYAEEDAMLPLAVLARQRVVMSAEGLTELFRMECGLIPLLLDMRFRGVLIDTDRAMETAKWLRAEAARFQSALPGIDVWSSESIARAFDAQGEEYLRTEAGNPSFTKDWLQACEHPLAKQILGVRMYEKAANPFVESYLLENVHNGRVHCQFNPLRSDAYGTVSGRFSSSNPNLQNIPSRDEVIGPRLRSLFIAAQGKRWRRADYSQIEYRLLAHDAVGDGADAVRSQYTNDPTTSFHKLVQRMVLERVGVELGYKPAKNLNFGMVYGMGKDKNARALGVSLDLGLRFYDAYHEALPFVKKTGQQAQRIANRRGYIRTILGRRRRYPLLPNGERQGAHAALNGRLQGSAADIMKKAMQDAYRAGLFEVTGTPSLTVHDELDFDAEDTPATQEAFREIDHIMTSCVKLRVPLMVEWSDGANWGECK